MGIGSCLGAVGFSGAGAFVAGAPVNNMELSCSCKRAVCCFSSSVVGFADGIAGVVCGGCCAGDVVSVFDEVLATGVTGGFEATVCANTGGAGGALGAGCDATGDAEWLVTGCCGLGGSGFASSGATGGAVATGFIGTGAGAAGCIAAGAGEAGAIFGGVGTAEGAEAAGCCAGE